MTVAKVDENGWLTTARKQPSQNLIAETPPAEITLWAILKFTLLPAITRANDLGGFFLNKKNPHEPP